MSFADSPHRQPLADAFKELLPFRTALPPFLQVILLLLRQGLAIRMLEQQGSYVQ